MWSISGCLLHRPSCLGAFITYYTWIRRKPLHGPLNSPSLRIPPSPIVLDQTPGSHRRLVTINGRELKEINSSYQFVICRIHPSHFHVDCVFSPSQPNGLERKTVVSILQTRNPDQVQIGGGGGEDSNPDRSSATVSAPHATPSCFLYVCIFPMHRLWISIRQFN